MILCRLSSSADKRPRPAQQLRQFANIGRDPARFIFAEQLCRRPSRLLLPVVVAHDKAGGLHRKLFP